MPIITPWNGGTGVSQDNAKTITLGGPLVTVGSTNGTLATLETLAASSGSSLVGFLQSGTGAVARKAQSKIREVSVSVEDFGAVGDGSADDSAAFLATIASLPAAGGIVDIQAKTYKATIGKITRPNITLRATAGFRELLAGAAKIIPFDNNAFILEVGDGTTICAGFRSQGVRYSGNSVGNFGVKINGADSCSYTDFMCDHFLTQGLYITSSATIQTTFQFFDRYYIKPSGAGTAVGLTLERGGTFSDGIFFNMGGIEVQDGSGMGVIVDGTPWHVSNTFMDGKNGATISIKNGGKIYGSLVTIDSPASTDVLIISDADTAYCDMIQGTIQVDGVLQTPAGNSAVLSGITPINRALLPFPLIQGKLVYSDSNLAPHLQLNRADAKVTMSRFGDNLDIDASTGTGFVRVRPGSGNLVLFSPAAGDPILDLINGTTSAAARILTHAGGSPENVITAPVGSICLRTDGGAGTSLYVKESGAGNTGWVGK